MGETVFKQNEDHFDLVGEELIEKTDIFDLDYSKIIISTENADINGPQLHEVLRRKYHLEMEMEAEQYILALTSVMDSREGFERLANALLEIDAVIMQSIEEKMKKYTFTDSSNTVKELQTYRIWEAVESRKSKYSFKESEGMSFGGICLFVSTRNSTLSAGRKNFRKLFGSGRTIGKIRGFIFRDYRITARKKSVF